MYFRRDFGQMEKLAQEGDVRAQAWMGLIMQQAKRRSEAKEWWQRAAEKGHAWAIDSLAMMYLMDKEDEKAAYWYRRGADLGLAGSQSRLAGLLLQGRGVPRNEQEAVRWYKAAAAQAYRYAYYPLAELHASGTGTNRDLIEAYALAEITEAILDPSETHKAQALKLKIAHELSPEQIARAVERAREIQAEVFPRRGP